MALVEVEFGKATFEGLLQTLTSAAPTPAPTFEALGNDRLIDCIEWKSVSVGEFPPGYVPPPGMVTARADVTVHHTSIAELEKDAHAVPARTDAVAWLLVSLPTPTVLTVAILRLDAAGQTSTFPVPLLVGSAPLGAAALAASVTSALVLRGTVVTIRFASSPGDNMLLPPANRLTQGEGEQGDSWLLRVSGDVFVAEVLNRLQTALSPPPGGTVVEDAPAASWTDVLSGQWRVVASVGLLQEDACLNVDISVTVSIEFSVTPKLNQGVLPPKLPELDLRLGIGGDVSDWDSFRCWATTGGLGSVVLGIFNPFAGLAAGLTSLVGISEYIRRAVGQEVTGTSVGDDLQEVSRTSSSAVYAGTVELPSLDIEKVTSADVGRDGLVVRGRLGSLPADHTRSFQPDTDTLPGSWHGTFSCKEDRYIQQYGVSSVLVSDEAHIGKVHLANVPVQIFPTSRIIPPDVGWKLSYPNTPRVNQFVHVQGHGGQFGQPTRAYIHTSAGIHRYDLATATARPPAPDDLTLTAMRFNCRSFNRLWRRMEQVRWLVDPPSFNYGRDPLRQWQITVSELPEGATLSLYAQGDTEDGDRSLTTVTAERTGPAAIEVVTDDSTELVLDHSPSELPSGARLTQRWLLPLHVVDLPGSPLALRRSGPTVEILTADHRVTMSTDDWTTEVAERRGDSETPAGGQMFSITLPDRRVVAVHGDQLVVAAPFGG